MAKTKNETFLKILRSGDVAGICDLIKRCPGWAKQRFPDEKTALHLVYDDIDPYKPIQADERLPIVQILLDKGADINAMDCFGKTPLFLAIEKHQINGVKMLLNDNGAFLFIHQTRPRRDYTALHCAISKHAINDQMVKLLLRRGADPNDYEYDEDYSFKKTVLAKAAEENRLDFVKILVENGARVNRKSKDEVNPLDFACRNYNLGMIKFLLSYGAKTDLNDGWEVTGLHKLALSTYKANENPDDLELFAKLMVKQQATAAHEPINTNFLKDLLNYGASIELGLFYKAVRNGFIDEVKLKLAQFTGVEVTSLKKGSFLKNWNSMFRYNRECLCILSVAAVLGCEKVVDCLINLGDHLVNQKNQCSEDSTELTRHPLHCAVSAGQYATAKLLIDAGCRIDECFSWVKPCWLLRDLDSLEESDNDDLDPRYDGYHHEYDCCDDSYDSYDSEKVEAFCRLNYNDNDLRLACLVWETSDISAVRESFEWFISSELEGDRFAPIWKKLTELLVLYYAIDIRINENDSDLIALKEYLIGKIDRCYGYNHQPLIQSCNDTLNKLKEEKALGDGKLCKYDILTMDLNSLVRFLNNRENFEACKKLCSTVKGNKCYEIIIKTRYQLAVEKRQLLDSAKSCLDKTFKSILESISHYDSLSNYVTFDVLSYLSTRELRELRKIANGNGNVN